VVGTVPGSSPGAALVGRWVRPFENGSRTPEMSTYRERREARADRLEGWAEKREERGVAAVERARDMASVIPFGQPMLTDHYSYGRDRRYRERIGSTFERGFADLKKADEMAGRAEGIRAQVGGSIYSDDADAIERLTEKIAGLEAERERIKAYNKSCRSAGGADLSLLTEAERENLASVRRVAAWQVGARGEFPAYHLSNLGGNITRQRKRLAQLESAGSRPVVARSMFARFSSVCGGCGERIEKGAAIRYVKGLPASHEGCGDPVPAVAS
jgi:hypothetical protein